MSAQALGEAERIARVITDDLGGRGVYGVEMFVRGDSVYFSEVSPRPHDTGLVTLVSQDLSQFALHVRAILGLPVPQIALYGPSASSAIVVEGESDAPSFHGLDRALREPGTALRLFGKPAVQGRRRMGVALARAPTIEAARDQARAVATAVLAGVRLR
jgi:phosphoribosylglycinamide formyltransferase 2